MLLLKWSYFSSDKPAKLILGMYCIFWNFSSNCIQFTSWQFLQHHSTYVALSRCPSIATHHILPVDSLSGSLPLLFPSIPHSFLPHRIGCPSIPPLRDPTELTASSGEADIGLLRAICNSSLGLVRATDGMNHGVNWSWRMLLDSCWAG